MTFVPCALRPEPVACRPEQSCYGGTCGWEATQSAQVASIGRLLDKAVPRLDPDSRWALGCEPPTFALVGKAAAQRSAVQANRRDVCRPPLPGYSKTMFKWILRTLLFTVVAWAWRTYRGRRAEERSLATR